MKARRAQERKQRQALEEQERRAAEEKEKERIWRRVHNPLPPKYPVMFGGEIFNVLNDDLQKRKRAKRKREATQEKVVPRKQEEKQGPHEWAQGLGRRAKPANAGPAAPKRPRPSNKFSSNLLQRLAAQQMSPPAGPFGHVVEPRGQVYPGRAYTGPNRLTVAKPPVRRRPL